MIVLLIIAGIALFCLESAFWAWLIMLVVGSLGAGLSFGSCYPIGLLVGLILAAIVNACRR